MVRQLPPAPYEGQVEREVLLTRLLELVYVEMTNQKVTIEELARRMQHSVGWTRLFLGGRYTTLLNLVEAAMALNMRVEARLVPLDR